MRSTAHRGNRSDANRGRVQSGVVPDAYWSIAPEQLLSGLRSSPNGLTQAEAEARLKQFGANALGERRRATAVGLFLNQFRNPLVLILIFAAIVSGVVGQWVDASIVLAVVLGSTILGFTQEYAANHAVQKLRSQTTIKSMVMRDGRLQSLPAEQLCRAMWCCFGGQPDPGRRRAAGSQGLLRQPGGADRRDLPGREAARRRRRPRPVWPSAPTASSWAPACAAARRKP